MTIIDETTINALYLELKQKHFNIAYCTAQELTDFRRLIMDLSKQTDYVVAVFSDQNNNSNACFYFDGYHVSILSAAKDILSNSLYRNDQKIEELENRGILYSAFLQTMKKELEREEEELHDKKFKYLQLSYEKQSQLKK